MDPTRGNGREHPLVGTVTAAESSFAGEGAAQGKLARAQGDSIDQLSKSRSRRLVLSVLGLARSSLRTHDRRRATEDPRNSFFDQGVVGQAWSRGQ